MQNSHGTYSGKERWGEAESHLPHELVSMNSRILVWGCLAPHEIFVKSEDHLRPVETRHITELMLYN